MNTTSKWTTAATKYLISLYEVHEAQMEDPRKKKKDIWEVIYKEMAAKGYKYSAKQLEAKWKNLTKSHKDIIDNKTKTGAKRKTFQYFEEIERIFLWCLVFFVF